MVLDMEEVPQVLLRGVVPCPKHLQEGQQARQRGEGQGRPPVFAVLGGARCECEFTTGSREQCRQRQGEAGEVRRGVGSCRQSTCAFWRALCPVVTHTGEGAAAAASVCGFRHRCRGAGLPPSNRSPNRGNVGRKRP